MEINHRVSFNSNTHSDLQEKLDALQIRYKQIQLPVTPFSVGIPGKLICFDIKESDNNWEYVWKWIMEYQLLDIKETIFSDQEILETKYLRLIPVYEQGYPEPQNDWPVNPINYKNFCKECGSYRQHQPFRMRQEPKLGKNSFMSFHWGYGLFCVKEVTKNLKDQKITGFEQWDVILHKKNMPSNVVSQIYVNNIAYSGLERVSDLKRITCSTCGITKYYPHMRGIMYMKKDSLLPNLDFQQSHEWFGSGHSAYREIIISNKVARLILKNKWKGVRLKVIELIS